jgi:hypothetical protein
LVDDLTRIDAVVDLVLDWIAIAGRIGLRQPIRPKALIEEVAGVVPEAGLACVRSLADG